MKTASEMHVSLELRRAAFRSSDNCGTVNVTNNAPAIIPVGTNIITWTATDTHGNSTNCTQNVTLTDTHHPTIACPALTYIIASPALCSTTNTTLTTPTVSDNS